MNSTTPVCFGVQCEHHTQAPTPWTTPCYVLIHRERYYKGGHPERADSWSPLLAEAKRYDRDTIHNIREHVSANTSGPAVQWEHEKLAPKDLAASGGAA